MGWTKAGAVAALGLIGALPAHASERRFTYTQQSLVLNPGALELEPSTTVRNGREDRYTAFDQRVEFEAGLAENLQAAFYLNFSAVSQDVGKTTTSDSHFDGVSLEAKYKLADPAADPVGLALYFEPAFGPDAAELEGKLILDKRMGDALLAFNVVGAHEWKFGPDETEREIEAEADLGFAWFFTPALSAGLEVRDTNEIPSEEGWETSVLFAGPVVSYAMEKWWATLTVTPQVAALKGADEGNLNLDEHERLEARLLIGLHL
jgi:hypothetical protein